MEIKGAYNTTEELKAELVKLIERHPENKIKTLRFESEDTAIASTSDYRQTYFEHDGIRWMAV